MPNKKKVVYSKSEIRAALTAVKRALAAPDDPQENIDHVDMFLTVYDPKTALLAMQIAKAVVEGEYIHARKENR